MGNTRTIDSWTYATRRATSFWLAPLGSGDMVFPNWPKMAKTVKIGLNGPHSRSHISMAMASNTLCKVDIDTWDLGPNICPMSTLEVASNHFSP